MRMVLRVLPWALLVGTAYAVVGIAWGDDPRQWTREALIACVAYGCGGVGWAGRR